MPPFIPRDFRCDLYRQLNPDLKEIVKDELTARLHWLGKGYQQGRLYHPKQLVVTAEFGQELLCYTCYYYYLYKQKLLFDNKITTYRGMRPYYWFVKPENLIERDNPRSFVEVKDRPLLFNRNEHVANFDYRYWRTLPLRSLYPPNQPVFGNTKPLLVIHNKYNDEWDTRRAINFIPVAELLQLVKSLQHKYQIIYLRALGTEQGFSRDHNRELPNFRDHEQLPETVWSFNKLLEQQPSFSYNELKIRLYSQCRHFIGVQGGSSHFAAFFGGRQLVLHIKGNESSSGAYNGWYRKLSSKEVPLELTVVNTPAALVAAARKW